MPPFTHTELPNLPRRFPCAQSSSPSPPFELRPLASIFVVVSPVALSSAKASTCGEKTIPAPFYFFPSRMPRRRSPAAGRPPPLAPCRGRRPNRMCKRTIEFAISLATRRCNPRTISWPGASFRPSPVTPPPRAAAAQPHAGVAGR
jgi:hypothetical protein